MTAVHSTNNTSRTTSVHGVREAPTPGQPVRRLVDACGRTIDHLRLSVTSACGLRCLYCRPVPAPARCHGDLSDAQRLDLVRFLHDYASLSQIRLTGGEPLLHPSLASLIADIRRAAPTARLAMTTNGVRLSSQAASLRAAGLDRLNISLDTLDREGYRALTGGCVRDVIDGIDAARAAGFPPPRLNCVVLAGQNEDQLGELADWSMARGLEIRFLEAMPIGPAAEFNRSRFVPARRIRDLMEARYRLVALPREPGETAARYRASLGETQGVIGIIAPVTERFCGQCRRIRITADGRLFPCLLDDRHVDLRSAWTGGRFSPTMAEQLICRAVHAKKAAGPALQSTAMVRLGG